MTPREKLMLCKVVPSCVFEIYLFKFTRIHYLPNFFMFIIFSLFNNLFYIFSAFFFVYSSLSLLPSSSRSVSGSRIWLGGFWTRLDFKCCPPYKCILKTIRVLYNFKFLNTELPIFLGKFCPSYQNFFQVFNIHVLGTIFSLKVSLR